MYGAHAIPDLNAGRARAENRFRSPQAALFEGSPSSSNENANAAADERWKESFSGKAIFNARKLKLVTYCELILLANFSPIFSSFQRRNRRA